VQWRTVASVPRSACCSQRWARTTVAMGRPAAASSQVSGNPVRGWREGHVLGARACWPCVCDHGAGGVTARATSERPPSEYKLTRVPALLSLAYRCPTTRKRLTCRGQGCGGEGAAYGTPPFVTRTVLHGSRGSTLLPADAGSAASAQWLKGRMLARLANAEFSPRSPVVRQCRSKRVNFRGRRWSSVG